MINKSMLKKFKEKFNEDLGSRRYQELLLRWESMTHL